MYRKVEIESPIFQRIDALMKLQGKKQRELTDHLGLERTSYTNWKKSMNNSYMLYLDRICSFLNTSPNYLILGDDAEKGCSLETDPKVLEQQIIHLFRTLKISQQRNLVSIAQMFKMG
ncbi:MAG: helix-turn-helix transcriptional regulator [Clostridia bacterium]|nr:helix-turn-helix transcriptional regulator [Clostridia bacterium]